jgi:hypothetical protein
MANFKGIRAAQQRRYDYISVDSEDGAVLVMVREGSDRLAAGLALDPKTARDVAADMIRLAEEIEEHRRHRSNAGKGDSHE